MTQMELAIRIFDALRQWGRKLGPYVLLELVMPGGTLFALLLFLYQNRKTSLAAFVPRPPAAITRSLVWQRRPA